MTKPNSQPNVHSTAVGNPVRRPAPAAAPARWLLPSALLLVVLAWSCRGVWPQDNPLDPGRCDPRCQPGQQCYQGGCINNSAKDAGVVDGLTGDDSRPPCNVGWQPARLLGGGNAQDLNAVWGTSTTQLMAVGNKGKVWQYDGTSWTAFAEALPPARANKNLKGIWGHSTSDFVVVGESGTILQWDGKRWLDQSVSLADPLTAAWFDPTGKQRIIVGNGAVVLRRDFAGVWQKELTVTTRNLNAVWGSSDSDIYAAGNMGTVVRYDPTKKIWGAFGPPHVSGSVYFHGMFGSGPSDIYVAGVRLGGHNTPVAYRYDGKTWIDLSPPASLGDGYFRAVAVVKNSDAYFVGVTGKVAHYNGSTWKVLPEDTVSDLSGAWSDDKGTLVAVGQKGAVVQYERPWQPMNSGKHAMLSAVWGVGPTLVYALGENMMFRYDGSQWSGELIKVKNQLIDGTVGKLWGSSPSHMLATGVSASSGAGKIFNYDGSTWSLDKSTPAAAPLYAVWTSSPSNSYAAGSANVSATEPILHYDGHAWRGTTAALKSTVYDLFGLANRVFAVGGGGAIWRLDRPAAVWSKENSGTARQLNGVWGNSATEMVAVGLGGTIVTKRDTGTTWKAAVSNTGADLTEVWGTTACDVYAVGNDGTVMHFDGKTWTPEITGTHHTLHSVWGDGKSSVYAVGNKGTILHRCSK